MQHILPFHFNSWLVYFYFYSIFGWIFESGNVSIRQKKWVNRGFMKGPWLPLYGSGAVIILLVTIPFAKNPVAVYFAGAIGATILEYVTGVVMLELFKVRYWDYRYRKFQFQGHICLVSTVVWGFLSLLMVYGVHPWVEKFVGGINLEIVNVLTFIITLLITYDFTNALREALDLRKLIIQANEMKEKLEDRIEEGRKQLDEYIEDRKERIEERQAALEENIAQIRAGLDELREGIELHSRKMFLRNPGASLKGLDEESRILKEKIFNRFDEMQKSGYGAKSAK